MLSDLGNTDDRQPTMLDGLKKLAADTAEFERTPAAVLGVLAKALDRHLHLVGGEGAEVPPAID